MKGLLEISHELMSHGQIDLIARIYRAGSASGILDPTHAGWVLSPMPMKLRILHELIEAGITIDRLRGAVAEQSDDGWAATGMGLALLLQWRIEHGD